MRHFKMGRAPVRTKSIARVTGPLPYTYNTPNIENILPSAKSSLCPYNRTNKIGNRDSDGQILDSLVVKYQLLFLVETVFPCGR